jgi:hypothetical protein
LASHHRWPGGHRSDSRSDAGQEAREGHQRLAGKAAVGAQQHPHAWPACPDLRDDAGHLLHRAGRGVDVRAPQLRRQQVPAAEHVERQVTVAIVVAVEEPAFLMAVQRIVGGVEVEDDLLRSLA